MPEISKQVTLECFPRCHLRFVTIARAVLRREFRLYVAPLLRVGKALSLKAPFVLYIARRQYHAFTFVRYSYFFYPLTVSYPFST